MTNNFTSVLGVLRCVAFVDTPYVISGFEGYPESVSDPGIEVEVAWRIFSQWGFGVRFLYAPGSMEAFSMVMNGSADIKVITQQRFLRMPPEIRYPSCPLYQDHPVFIIPIPYGKIPDKLVLFFLFKWGIWLPILITSIFLFGFLQATFHVCEESLIPYRSHYFCFRATIWLMFGVLLGLYANCLALSFEKPIDPKLQFQNLKDLSDQVRRKKCQIYSTEYQDFAEMLNDTGRLVYKPKYYSFLRPTDWFEDNISMKEMLDFLLQQNSNNRCTVVLDYASRLAAYRVLAGARQLQALIAEDLTIEYSFTYRSSLPSYTEDMINKALCQRSTDDLYRSRITRHALRMMGKPKYAANRKHVFALKREHTRITDRPLSMTQLIDLFAFLVLSSLMAFALFASEHVWKVTKKCRKRRKKLKYLADFTQRSQLSLDKFNSFRGSLVGSVKKRVGRSEKWSPNV